MWTKKGYYWFWHTAILSHILYMFVYLTHCHIITYSVYVCIFWCRYYMIVYDISWDSCLVVWNMFDFPYVGNNYNNPNWLIFFRGVETTNQLCIVKSLIPITTHLKMTTPDCCAQVPSRSQALNAMRCQVWRPKMTLLVGDGGWMMIYIYLTQNHLELYFEWIN